MPAATSDLGLLAYGAMSETLVFYSFRTKYQNVHQTLTSVRALAKAVWDSCGARTPSTPSSSRVEKFERLTRIR